MCVGCRRRYDRSCNGCTPQCASGLAKSRRSGQEGVRAVALVEVLPTFVVRCGAVLLIIVFAKNEKADLTADERREIKKLIEEAEQELCP